MSLASFAVGEVPLATQEAAKSHGKPPRHRQTAAKADLVAAPEPR